MHDPQLVFNELNLREGDCFLDFGCGVGDYAVHASKIVGDSGRVYALDISKTMVDGLTELADSQGFKNVEAMVSDISHPLPIKNNCVDVCLIATVLHIIGLAEDGKKLFKEIYRVLKKDGQLSIINCKKEAQPFGPPLQMRLAPTEVEESLKKHGFEKTNIIDLGYNYMITFQKPENRQDFKEAQ
ncbi:MAG: SAM-dependent methyltransferase [Candidatus Bathyarchaeum sp.]|nr:MAG: SAM-dependent methyltransferase [Candidatus Bathyarchaeum sp.]